MGLLGFENYDDLKDARFDTLPRAAAALAGLALPCPGLICCGPYEAGIPIAVWLDTTIPLG
jgi:hypothetical protein